MQNDVVGAIHQLAAASKLTGDITFTDKDRNILTDYDYDEDDQDIEKCAYSSSRL